MEALAIIKCELHMSKTSIYTFTRQRAVNSKIASKIIMQYKLQVANRLLLQKLLPFVD